MIRLSQGPIFWVRIYDVTCFHLTKRLKGLVTSGMPRAGAADSTHFMVCKDSVCFIVQINSSFIFSFPISITHKGLAFLVNPTIETEVCNTQKFSKPSFTFTPWNETDDSFFPLGPDVRVLCLSQTPNSALSVCIFGLSF